MKRAPIVLASTAAGLGFVLGYNPHSASSLVSAATTTAATTAAATPTTATAPAAAATTAAAAPTTTAAPATTATAASGTATGTVEQISEGGRPFGQIQVKATVATAKVTAVSIVQLSPSDGRSSSIDDYAVPQLVQETLAAGSAKIDHVSGATYTSQAYVASLQAALDKLA
jgi:uncharacterized protein with FMN-binding domain